jgi:hypothetical protein
VGVLAEDLACCYLVQDLVVVDIAGAVT